jgi:tryptophan halogenase
MSIPDTLANRMEMYRETGLVFPDGEDVFRIDSWLQVLVGQRLEARSYHHVANLLGDERLRKMLATLRASIAAGVEKMPTHKAFLDQYCAVQK